MNEDPATGPASVDLRADGRDETPQERSDRNLLELLNELRVALPGVQLLFGFLLIVPFTGRFADVTEFQKDLYFVVLLLTTIATALLIAPTALHRLLFHMEMKAVIVQRLQPPRHRGAGGPRAGDYWGRDADNGRAVRSGGVRHNHRRDRGPVRSAVDRTASQPAQHAVGPPPLKH